MARPPRVGSFPATRSAQRTYMQRFRTRRNKSVLPRRPPMFVPPAAPAPIPSAADVDVSVGSLSGGVGGYDIMSDPAVAMAAGLAAKARAMAQATALAKRKQAALEYGDPTGVEGVDEQTAKAARENPFSILRNLERSYMQGREQLEEGLNAANLFYSGYRGKQLAEAARNYEQSRYQAGTAFRGLMADINENLARALLEADYMEAQALLGSGGGSYSYGDEPGQEQSEQPGSVEQALVAPRAPLRLVPQAQRKGRRIVRKAPGAGAYDYRVLGRGGSY